MNAFGSSRRTTGSNSRSNLNYGLRWEYFGPLHSNAGNNLGVFVPGQGLEIQGAGIANIYKPDITIFRRVSVSPKSLRAAW